MAVVIQRCMLHWEVDPRSAVPVYRQVMDQVERYVAAGALKPGDLLPSIRELARALRINPTTVVKALGELDHAGVIRIEHGRGAFVADRPKLPSAERDELFRPRAREAAVAARQLGLSATAAARLLKEEIERLEGGG